VDPKGSEVEEVSAVPKLRSHTTSLNTTQQPRIEIPGDLFELDARGGIE